MTSPTSHAPTLDDLRARVGEVFGFDELRPLQAEATEAVLAGRDALVVLPTGGGKSLCFQAPALVLPGFTLVVSPLIALMDDQLRSLEGHGVAAGVFTSTQEPEERDATWDRLRAHELDILYCSPERLALPGFFERLVELGASRLAVDEAHCISHWGHDFRPEYRMLGELRRRGSRLPIMALTATATPRVQNDIVAALELEDELRLVGDFDRPNLTYRIVPRRDTATDVYGVVSRHGGDAGIVYVLRRKDAESLASDLAGRGVRCRAYHAGLDGAERRSVQNDFLSERIDVVVATVAFGMGIDRSDVRFVVHASLPKGVEQYSQETGRAGRDGLPAECVMFYSGADYHGWCSLMERSSAEADEAGVQGAREELRESLERLSELWRFAGGALCRHRFLVEHFGGTFHGSNDESNGCGACDVCLGELETVPDGLVVAQKILSCVVHCRHTYGAGHVANVLRGANTARIRELGHADFTTFGLLKDMSQGDVRTFIDQLVSKELLLVAPGQYPTLALSKSGADVLRGERDVELFLCRRPQSVAGRSRSRSGSRGPSPILDDPNLDTELVESLRGLRRRLASERGVPPYVLFNDRTLVDLVSKRPTTTAELLDVVGIGAKKAEDLGEILLTALGEA